jgi:hypothetical protein
VRGVQIAQDDVAFPEREIVLLQCRHQARRVHLPILGRIGLAERAADIDPLERQAHLAKAPKDFHHVARGRAAPDDAFHLVLSLTQEVAA